jgi:kinesin family protein 3/17
MEERLVVGGNALEEREKQQAQIQRKWQLELEVEKKKQQELLEEKQRQEDALLEKEKHYNNLQEEVEDCRKIIKKLKQKNKVQAQELKDFHKENIEKNEELLDTVREQSKEIDFLNQLVSYLLNEEQLFKIKEKTNWNEEQQKWKLPPFQLKKKEIAFPKLGNAKQFV